MMLSRLRPMLVVALATPVILQAQVPDDASSRRVRSRDAQRQVDRALRAPGVSRHTGAMTVGPRDRVSGPLVVEQGPLTIAGRVDGDVTAVDADVALLPGAVIEGDLLVVGGGVTGRDSAVVRGDITVYQGSGRSFTRYVYSTPRPMRPRNIGASDRQDDAEDAWVAKWREREWSQSRIRLTMARTYNRVEGWPVVAGPIYRTDFGWGRAAVDLFGIFRTAQGTEWNTNTVGHRARAELRLGRNFGLTVGGRAYDIVDAVEPWQLSDGENGLAAFFLKKDLRDWYNRHGGQGYARLFAFNGAVTLGATYGQERWTSRDIHNVFALFNRATPWRANPLMDEGLLHLATAQWILDTRNDRDDPTSGWFIAADYERGRGTLSQAPTSAGVRPLSASPAPVQYGRGFIDARRYNRLAPDAELRLRVVAGGWVDGDPLPLQRRFSLSGPAALPGFAFRSPTSAAALECGGGIPGLPAQCDRMALAQIEYRGSLHIDVFDWLGDATDIPRARVGPRDGLRHRGWSSKTRGSFVLFADAGRGWLVGTTNTADARFVPKSELPRLSTFRTDAGVGLELGVLGLYVAKAMDAPSKDEPAVFFVRVNRRF
ncbi:MAG: hypothetical protein SFW08_08120 [Gemmatimonadaceae bacterium]|nr:hypothetical protein [Gemmatimonadaceae bacterium]